MARTPPPLRRPVLLLAGALALLAAPVAPGQSAAPQGPEPPQMRSFAPAVVAPLRERLEVLREENDRLRERVLDLHDRIIRLESDLPHTQEQLDSRIGALEDQTRSEISGMESTLSLYMRVGTFVLILLGVFGFGYIHTMLRDIIERAAASHLRSEEFSQNLQEKVETAAEEARGSILEAGREETRQLTRKLIDEFLSEERTRIEEAIQEEQDALRNLRHEHLDLQSPVSDEAGEYLEKVATAVSDRSLDMLTDEELYYAMVDADAKHHYHEAERYARELLRRHPSTPDSLANLAWILEHGGRVEEAEAHYKRALEADSSREDIARYYAYLLDSLGRTEEARELLGKVLQRHPEDPRTLGQYAQLLVRHGQYEEAEDRLKGGLESHPGDRGLLTGLARLLARRGRYDEAIRSYQEALEHSPHDRPVLAEVAELELMRGGLDGAEAHVDELLEQEPESVEGLTLRGRIFLERGRYAEAEVAFRQGLTNDPQRVNLVFYLGHSLLGQGRHAEATDVYNQALEASPDPDAVRAFGIEPTRHLSEVHGISGAQEFIEWLQKKAEAGRPTEEAEPGE